MCLEVQCVEQNSQAQASSNNSPARLGLGNPDLSTLDSRVGPSSAPDTRQDTYTVLFSPANTSEKTELRAPGKSDIPGASGLVKALLEMCPISPAALCCSKGQNSYEIPETVRQNTALS